MKNVSYDDTVKFFVKTYYVSMAEMNLLSFSVSPFQLLVIMTISWPTWSLISNFLYWEELDTHLPIDGFLEVDSIVFDLSRTC